MSSESHLQVSVLLEEGDQVLDLCRHFVSHIAIIYILLSLTEEPDQSTNVFVKHNLSTLSKSDLDIHVCHLIILLY